MGSYCLMGAESQFSTVNWPLENGFDFSCVILQVKKKTLENQRIRIQPHMYF